MFIRQFKSEDTDAVVKIWMRCGLSVPSNNPWEDIKRKMKVNPELFLVGEEGGTVISTAMGGYEGHRGWVNYLAVHPDYQRRGHGKMIMRALEDKLVALGCPKLNLQIRGTNLGVIGFYEKIGYWKEDRVSMGKRLIDDNKYHDNC